MEVPLDGGSFVNGDGWLCVLDLIQLNGTTGGTDDLAVLVVSVQELERGVAADNRGQGLRGVVGQQERRVRGACSHLESGIDSSGTNNNEVVSFVGWPVYHLGHGRSTDRRVPTVQ